MRIGYCVGVFDVLHYGHKNILTKCYEKSDILIVGIHTDKFVQSYKRKPRESEETRLKKVQEFLNLDKNHIHLIDDDHIQLIRKFNVNVGYSNHNNDKNTLNILTAYNPKCLFLYCKPRRKKGRIYPDDEHAFFFEELNEILNQYDSYLGMYKKSKKVKKIKIFKDEFKF